ncbi:MAG TPA: hypothetical protein VEC76_18755 [Streptosporangiaceae bacterium]|nr:hypothetical protein [Streptosporangiaceae bacterium]
MSGTALFHIAFAALVVVILLIVWAALVMETGARPPRRAQEVAGPGDEPGEADVPERSAA